MKCSYNIREKTLIEFLSKVWGLKVVEIKFIPKGAAGWLYMVRNENIIFLLKVTKKLSKSSVLTTAKLFETGNSFVVAPIKTKRGDYWYKFGEGYLLLYPFIEGSVLGEISLEQVDYCRIAKYLSTLHTTSVKIANKLPRENYTKFQRHVASLLTSIGGLTTNNVQKSFMSILEEHSEKIKLILSGAISIGEKLRKLNPTQVICHSDIHLYNIMLDFRENMYFVDWDGLMKAPKERDLFFYTTGLNVKKEFIGCYGNKTYNREIIKYYKLEWVLQEISDYANQLTDLKLKPAQKEHALRELTSIFNYGDVVTEALQVL